jgi:hypothetical protein
MDAEARETQALLTSPEVQRAIKEAAAVAAAEAVAAVMAAVMKADRGEGVTTSAATEQLLATDIVTLPRNKVVFDPDARIVEVPPELENAGVHDGFELCELDGQPGYQVVDRLKRDEPVLRLGVPMVLRFASGSETTTIRLLLTDAVPTSTEAAEPASAPRIYRRPRQSASQAAADAMPPPLEPPPRLPDDPTPFGPRAQPNMPEQDLRFFESMRQRREEAPYDPYRMPDGPPPSHYWDH